MCIRDRFNCGHPTVPRNIDVTRISKSDLQKVRSFDPTQLIDSCTYIPLETSDRILIGRVKQLKITDKYIFLVNSENDSLYVFNRQGKFLNTIGTRAEAHGNIVLFNLIVFRLRQTQ